MKRLYLASAKLDGLLQLINGPTSKFRFAFIPTAADPYQDRWFMHEDRKKLLDMGFQIQDIDLKSATKDFLAEKLKKFDGIYVAGGNTFYLLEKMQQSGFTEIIGGLVEQGILYAGGSAGAVVAGPTIEPVDVFDDPKDAPNLKSMAGLHLVDFIVLPHYGADALHNAKHNEVIKKWKQKGYELIPITNDQAIIVEGEKVTVVEI